MDAPTAGMRGKRTGGLYDHWKGGVHGGKLPTWREFNPVEMYG